MLFPYMLQFSSMNRLLFNQSGENYNYKYSKNRYGPQRAVREDLKKCHSKSKSKESGSIKRNPGFKNPLKNSDE